MPNKALKYFAKETLYVALALCGMFLMIIITSISHAGLDPAKLWSKENLSNILINASITLFGTIAAVPSGAANTKQRVNPDGTNGRYLQEFYAYNAIRKAIEPRRPFFSQWHHAQYLIEQKSKRVNYLLERSIIQADDILELSREQIFSLTEPQVYKVNGEDVCFKALSVKQVIACLKVYDGKIIVHKLPDFYFLYIDGKNKRTFYDQAYYEAKDENSSMLIKIFTKAFLGFLITSIFTGLVVDVVSADEITFAYIAHTALLIVTRLFNAVTSTLWGYLIGQESVYKRCYYINGKTQFLQQFDTDRDFEYKDIRQIAREEYIQTHEGGLNNGKSKPSTPDS